jgi:hypothetical protein
MDSGKRPKRLFELESCASAQQEASQNETARVEDKRQRTAIVNSGDDFAEFVALLDRIQYMKTRHLNLGISEDKVIKTKLPRIPSFEWEDFLASAAEDTLSAQRDICSPSVEDHPGSSEEKRKQSNQPDNHQVIKTASSSDPNGKCPAERFDLNVEAS